MDVRRNEIPGIVRNTLEYHEARTLLAEKAKVQAELKQINAELKQIRRLSPDALELAKTEAQNGYTDS